MVAAWVMASSSSVVMPSTTAAPTSSSTSAAMPPATRMRAMTSAVCTLGPRVAGGSPVTAYGGLAIDGGTGRRSPTSPALIPLGRERRRNGGG